MRKVIQIAVAPANVTYAEDTLYALCDDGSIYSLYIFSSDDEWRSVQPIPQDDES